MSASVSTAGTGFSAGGLLNAVAVQSSAYTANPGELVPVDTSGGAVTITFPAAPADGTTIGVKMVRQGGANAVTVALGGADTINTQAGSASGTITLLNQALLLQYKASISVWYVLMDSLALSQLDSRYDQQSVMTTLGDLLYENSTPAPARLAGNTSATKKMLSQTGNGTISAAPAWAALVAGDIPGTLGATAFSGIASPNAGTSSAGSAPILTAVAGTNGGGGVQLSDHTRDYMVYLEVGTAGTAWIVSMGATSGASDVTLHASGTATAGQVLSFRLPAGWYFLWSATAATLAQSVAVGC